MARDERVVWYSGFELYLIRCEIVEGKVYYVRRKGKKRIKEYE